MWEILSHAMTWMDLEDIMLKEISPVAKGQIQYASTYIRYFRSQHNRNRQ